MKAGTKTRPEIPTLTRTNSKPARELRQLFRELWQKKLPQANLWQQKVATENYVATFFLLLNCHKNKSGLPQAQGRDTDTGERDTDTGERHRHEGETQILGRDRDTRAQEPKVNQPVNCGNFTVNRGKKKKESCHRQICGNEKLPQANSVATFRPDLHPKWLPLNPKF